MTKPRTMIATEQVVSLIRSHMDKDDVQFRKIAMQIAASEAKAGHRVAASRINEALLSRSFDGKLLKLKSLNSDISDLVIVADKHYQLKDLVVSSEISSKIDRIIKEYMEQDKLHKYNLDNRRRLLLYGTSGTG